MSIFFFFKQKTAYELRISDWSSDVCSSDLLRHDPGEGLHRHGRVRLHDQGSGAARRAGPEVADHDPVPRQARREPEEGAGVGGHLVDGSSPPFIASRRRSTPGAGAPKPGEPDTGCFVASRLAITGGQTTHQCAMQ